MRTVFGGLLAAALSCATPAFAQSTTWNSLSDRFQIDTGYFRLDADTVLRYQGPQGGSGEIDMEEDAGLPDSVNTFWVDGTWRVGRRHQLKLAFTRTGRDRRDFALQRDFTWGGETYNAGMTATSSSAVDILGGYYRFAIVRNDRFEIGPAIGIGYLWLDARIQATGTVTGPGGVAETRERDRAASTGSITGAIGGYVMAWPAKRLLMQADYLYIRVNPEDSEAEVNDWRVAANYYFTPSIGLGLQYKHNSYRYDRGRESTQLGGELTAEGFQLFLSFRF
jgi:hypothetical protein